MKTSVQQIMIGSISNKYDEALNTLLAIKEMGYDAIELNSFMIHPTSFLVRMLTKLAKMPTGKGGKLNWHELVNKANLEVSALHIDLGSLERNIDEVIKEAKSFNTNYLVITGMYRFNYTSVNDLNDLCSRLNKVGKKLKENDLNLLYHNHNVEFKRLEDNTFAYDYLISNLNSEYVNFEFDSFWAISAGANPIEYMDKLKDRMKLYHINDLGNIEKGPFMTPILKNRAIELGKGSINLDALINKALEYGVNTIVLEQHNNFVDKDVLKSIKESKKFLDSYNK